MSVLELNHVKKSFNNGKLQVLQDISLSVEKGEVVAIIGPSGSGKSTLLRCATLLERIDSGEVCFDGKKLTPRQRRSLSYLVMQDTDYQLFASSVEEELSLGMQEDCKEKIDAVLNALELSDYRERHPASLSGGQKQRIAIARIYIKNPKIIIFDEATSALDSQTEIEIHNAWKDVLAGRTSIVIAHRQSSVMMCDKAAIIENGKICEIGIPEKMIRESNTFKTLFAIKEFNNYVK